MPRKFNTAIERGCPYDCGLCPDHEQHSCLALVEITDHCNLTCPICYAESSPRRPLHRSLEQIAFMLDCVVRNEGRPDIVQISGGEPTIHPEFFAVLDLAKERPIKHLMVNTNGVRIAQDAGLRPAAGRVQAGLRGLSPVRLARRGARNARCAARTWSRSAPGHSSTSTSTGSRPRWSSRSRKGSTTTRSARSSTSRWSSPACAG